MRYTVGFRGDVCYNSPQPFYREDFDEDATRVDTLFRDASRAGVAISQRSLAPSDIDDFLASGAWLLVLIDVRSVACLTCETAERKRARLSADSFIGHVVLVVGRTSDAYAVLDPSSSSHAPCWFPLAAFHAARRAHGTDEDVIVVHNYPPHRALSPG